MFRPSSTCEGCAPEELFCEGARLVRAQFPNREENGRQRKWLHILNITEHSDGSLVEIHLDPAELESDEQVATLSSLTTPSTTTERGFG